LNKRQNFTANRDVKVQRFNQLLGILETKRLNFEVQIGVNYEWSGIIHKNQNRIP